MVEESDEIETIEASGTLHYGINWIFASDHAGMRKFGLSADSEQTTERKCEEPGSLMETAENSGGILSLEVVRTIL